MEEVRPSGLCIMLCGAAAGALHFAVMGLFNAVILRDDLLAWTLQAGSMLHPLTPPAAMALWATMSVCFGLVGIGYYAAASARRGGGLRTALLVGSSLWLVTKVTVALDLFALGIMPTRVIIGQSIGGFVAIVAAVLVGATLLNRWGNRKP